MGAEAHLFAPRHDGKRRSGRIDAEGVTRRHPTQQVVHPIQIVAGRYLKWRVYGFVSNPPYGLNRVRSWLDCRRKPSIQFAPAVGHSTLRPSALLTLGRSDGGDPIKVGRREIIREHVRTL
jgi:hypothetical protein